MTKQHVHHESPVVLLPAVDRPGLFLAMLLDSGWFAQATVQLRALGPHTMQSVPERATTITLVRFYGKRVAQVRPNVVSHPQCTFGSRELRIARLRRQLFDGASINWNGDQPHAHFSIASIPLATMLYWWLHIADNPTLAGVFRDFAVADAAGALKALEGLHLWDGTRAVPYRNLRRELNRLDLVPLFSVEDRDVRSKAMQFATALEGPPISQDAEFREAVQKVMRARVDAIGDAALARVAERRSHRSGGHEAP